MTLDEETPTTPAGPAIPDFKGDERQKARYASTLERRIKDFFREHERSIRENASAKREELREERARFEAEGKELDAIATETREAYRLAYPHHVTKLRIKEPSTAENLKSFGSAGKLYRLADEAWRNAERVAGELRRIEHNEEQLDIELQKALAASPQIAKEITESPKWLAEIHAEPELAELRAAVDAIDAERAAYAERLARGAVPPDEQRLRAFGEGGIARLAPPVTGIIFVDLMSFGTQHYLIARDARDKRYALPYDRRLEPLLDGIFDIVDEQGSFVVRRTRSENGPLPLAPSVFFKKAYPNDDEAATAAIREHAAFAREVRMLANTPNVDEADAAVIGLFAAFAQGKAA